MIVRITAAGAFTTTTWCRKQRTEMIKYDRLAWEAEPLGFIGPVGSRAVPDFGTLNVIAWTLIVQWRETDWSVLDAGCIDGRYIHWLRTSGFTGRYIGLDITSSFLQRAIRNEPLERFCQGDVRRLPFADSSFDIVLCSNVLMHLQDLGGCVLELCRVAKRNVILSMYGDRHASRITHDPSFLNFWRTEEELTRAIPEGWDIIATAWIRPEWDVNALLLQAVLESKSWSQ